MSRNPGIGTPCPDPTRGQTPFPVLETLTHSRHIAFNCASVNPELLESRFFGHERGTFTDAKATTDGLFHMADGGVIPIEVKATNGATVSLNETLLLKGVVYGYKFVDGNVGVSGSKITLPHFMCLFV